MYDRVFEGGHIEAITYLLNRRTIWSQHTEDGRTLLMEAIDQNREDVLECLLKNAPDGALEQTDSKGIVDVGFLI